MDSLTYKGLVTTFDKGLMRLTERLESAVDGDLSKAETKETVAAVRSKLAEYDDCLAKFGSDAATRGDFEKRFKAPVRELLDGLAKLK